MVVIVATNMFSKAMKKNSAHLAHFVLIVLVVALFFVRSLSRKKGLLS